MEFKNLKEARENGLVNIHEIKKLFNKTGVEIRKAIKSDENFPHIKVGRYIMFDLEKVKAYGKEKTI